MAIKKKDGSSQVTRLALDRKAQSDRLSTVAETHAQAIETEARKLVGEAAAKNLEVFVLALGSHVAALGEDLVAREHAHAQELSDDDAPRQQRDAADAALRAAIVELQEIFTGLYGSGFLVRAKLAGTPPKNPKDLPEWVAPAVHTLATLKPADLPNARVAGAKPELKEWHARLATPLEALRTALGDVLREETEAVETVGAPQ